MRDNLLVLCHGRAIAAPPDAQYLFDRCKIEGFYGASSMERLPAEKAITARVGEFVNRRLDGA